MKGKINSEKKLSKEKVRQNVVPSVKEARKVATSPVPQRSSTEKSNEENVPDEQDGFTFVKSRRRRNIIFGNKIDNDLEVAVKEVDLHIWRLAPNVTEQDVVKYIKKSKDEDVNCERLNARGNYSSFKVTIKETSMADLMSPEFWPEGVAIDRFFRRKRFPELS